MELFNFLLFYSDNYGRLKVLPSPGSLTVGLTPRAKIACFACIYGRQKRHLTELAFLLFCCTNNRIIISFFVCTNELEYKNEYLLPEKGKCTN